MKNEAGGRNRTHAKARACREERVTDPAGAAELPEAFRRGAMRGNSCTEGARAEAELIGSIVTGTQHVPEEGHL